MRRLDDYVYGKQTSSFGAFASSGGASSSFTYHHQQPSPSLLSWAEMPSSQKATAISTLIFAAQGGGGNSSDAYRSFESLQVPVEMHMNWDYGLVIISYLCSVQAAYTAVLILQMRISVWLIAVAALCLSVSGIWSMHFIGMAAMTIGVDVTFNLGWTIASVFFAYFPTFGAFMVIDRAMMKIKRIRREQIAAKQALIDASEMQHDDDDDDNHENDDDQEMVSITEEGDVSLDESRTTSGSKTQREHTKKKSASRKGGALLNRIMNTSGSSHRSNLNGSTSQKNGGSPAGSPNRGGGAGASGLKEARERLMMKLTLQNEKAANRTNDGSFAGGASSVFQIPSHQNNNNNNNNNSVLDASGFTQARLVTANTFFGASAIFDPTHPQTRPPANFNAGASSAHPESHDSSDNDNPHDPNRVSSTSPHHTHRSSATAEGSREQQGDSHPTFSHVAFVPTSFPTREDDTVAPSRKSPDPEEIVVGAAGKAGGDDEVPVPVHNNSIFFASVSNSQAPTPTSGANNQRRAYSVAGRPGVVVEMLPASPSAANATSPSNKLSVSHSLFPSVSRVPQTTNNRSSSLFADRKESVKLPLWPKINDKPQDDEDASDAEMKRTQRKGGNTNNNANDTTNNKPLDRAARQSMSMISDLGAEDDTRDISFEAHKKAFLRAPHGFILLGGAMIALGACLMHYLGMHAMSMEGMQRSIDAGVVFASVLIALFAGTAALYFAFILPLTREYTVPTALVAGAAVSGMHYVGMYGIKYSVSLAFLAQDYLRHLAASNSTAVLSEDSLVVTHAPSGGSDGSNATLYAQELIDAVMSELNHKGDSSIQPYLIYIIFASAAVSSISLSLSSYFYRVSLRNAADDAETRVKLIVSGKFDELAKMDKKKNKKRGKDDKKKSKKGGGGQKDNSSSGECDETARLHQNQKQQQGTNDDENNQMSSSDDDDEVDDRTDPIMARLNRSNAKLGEQLQKLRSFMPPSLLAQYEALTGFTSSDDGDQTDAPAGNEDGDDDDDDEGELSAHGGATSISLGASTGTSASRSVNGRVQMFEESNNSESNNLQHMMVAAAASSVSASNNQLVGIAGSSPSTTPQTQSAAVPSGAHGRLANINLMSNSSHNSPIAVVTAAAGPRQSLGNVSNDNAAANPMDSEAMSDNRHGGVMSYHRSGAGTTTVTGHHQQRGHQNAMAARNNNTNVSSQRQATPLTLNGLGGGIVIRNIAVLSINCHGFARVMTDYAAQFMSLYTHFMDGLCVVAKAQRGLMDIVHGDRVIITFNAALKNAAPGKACALAAVQIAQDVGAPGVCGCVAIGVASGQAKVGNMGSSAMMRYNVCGNSMAHAVLASQYAYDQHAPCGVHIAGFVSDEMKAVVRHRALGIAQWRHMTRPAIVSEIVGLRSSGESAGGGGGGRDDGTSQQFVSGILGHGSPSGPSDRWMNAKEAEKQDPFGQINRAFSLALVDAQRQRARQQLQQKQSFHPTTFTARNGGGGSSFGNCSNSNNSQQQQHTSVLPPTATVVNNMNTTPAAENTVSPKVAVIDFAPTTTTVANLPPHLKDVFSNGPPLVGGGPTQSPPETLMHSSNFHPSDPPPPVLLLNTSNMVASSLNVDLHAVPNAIDGAVDANHLAASERFNNHSHAAFGASLISTSNRPAQLLAGDMRADANANTNNNNNVSNPISDAVLAFSPVESSSSHVGLHTTVGPQTGSVRATRSPALSFGAVGGGATNNNSTNPTSDPSPRRINSIVHIVGEMPRVPIAGSGVGPIVGTTAPADILAQNSEFIVPCLCANCSANGPRTLGDMLLQADAALLAIEAEGIDYGQSFLVGGCFVTGVENTTTPPPAGGGGVGVNPKGSPLHMNSRSSNASPTQQQPRGIGAPIAAAIAISRMGAVSRTSSKTASTTVTPRKLNA